MKKHIVLLLLTGALALFFAACSSSQEEDYWDSVEKQQAEEEAMAEEAKPEEPPKAEEPADKPMEEPPAAKEEAAMMEQPPPPPEEPPMEPVKEQKVEEQPLPRFGAPAAVSRAFGPAPGVASADPTRPVQIAIMASPRQPNAGNRMATTMGLYHKEKLEKSLGRKVELAFISRSERLHGPKSRIRYRRGFVQVAIQLAAMLPDQQEIRQMTPTEQGEAVVDVMIYLGDTVR